MAEESIERSRHIVLLGASVGKAWNVSEAPGRMRNENYNLEYTGCYQFDKSSVLNPFLQREKDKPDAIILKECAAYFPGDITFENAKTLMKSWIQQCQDAGIVPIPATVAPVTQTRDERYKTHNPLKRAVKRILGISMMTQMERIMEYNDWIKAYSREKDLVVLDLEAPLRISETDRYLKDEYTKGDGLHLNKEAYSVLDNLLISTLEKVKFH